MPAHTSRVMGTRKATIWGGHARESCFRTLLRECLSKKLGSSFLGRTCAFLEVDVAQETNTCANCRAVHVFVRISLGVDRDCRGFLAGSSNSNNEISR